jgi:urea transport system substrate-binding protein
VAAIKKFGSAGKKTAVVSTINGDANVPFYRELGNQKVSAKDIPVVAFSVGEEELSRLDAKPLVGHLAAWNYFMSVRTPANEEFISKWKTFIKTPGRTINDPMEAHYVGFNLWVKAVERAKSTDVDSVLATLPDLETPNLTGGTANCSPITTSPSRSTLARYAQTASSTSCGRPRAPCRAMPGRITSPSARTRWPTG